MNIESEMPSILALVLVEGGVVWVSFFEMADGENIYVRGFGSFVNKRRAPKVGRNISKNTAIMIEEHYIPSFKPSKTFVSLVKNSEKVKLANKK